MPLGIQQMACSDITRWNYRPVRYKACYFSVIIIIQNKGVSITLLFLFCFFAFFCAKRCGFFPFFSVKWERKETFFYINNDVEDKKNSRNGRCLSFFFSLKFIHSFALLSLHALHKLKQIYFKKYILVQLHGSVKKLKYCYSVFWQLQVTDLLISEVFKVTVSSCFTIRFLCPLKAQWVVVEIKLSREEWGLLLFLM